MIQSRLFATLLASLMLLALVAGNWAIAGGHDAAERSREPVAPVTIDDINRFMIETELELMHAMRRRWSSAKPFEALAIAEGLADRCARTAEECPVTDYVWEEGTHDLTLLAARAAWAIEGITGVPVEKLSRESVKEMGRSVHTSVSRQIEAFRSGAIAVSRAYEPCTPIEELKTRYRHRIVTGITAQAYEASAAMYSLLGEWCPLGKQLSDLEIIAGPPSRRGTHVARYHFDTGFGGYQFSFVVERGVIVSVVIEGME